MNYFKSWIDDIAQRSLPYKATFICVISLFVFAIFYFFIGNKQKMELERLKFEESKLIKTINDIQAALVNPDEYYDQVNQLIMLQEKLEQQFQIDFTLLNLLYTLSQIGSELGLTYISIEPGKQEFFEFYSTFTINISLIGHFQQLIRYISKLFELNFLITLDECRMNPIIEEQEVSYYQIHENQPIELEMTILVYRFE